MMKDVLLIGAGGHCKSCIDVIEQIVGWRIAGIVDRKDSGTRDVMGYPVVGCDEDLSLLRGEYEYAFLTMGQIRSAEIKVSLFNQLKSLGFTLPVFISPLAYVSKNASIGEGSIVMHHALVNVAATIGSNCIINSKALIEHDVSVGDNCHIATAAVINGGVVIGEQTFVGSNSVVKQAINIPPRAFIKAGTLMK